MKKASKKRPVRFQIKDVMVELPRSIVKPMGPCACDTYCTECSGQRSCGCTDWTCNCTDCSGHCSATPATMGHKTAEGAVTIYSNIEKKLAAALAEVKKQKKIWQAKHRKAPKRR